MEQMLPEPEREPGWSLSYFIQAETCVGITRQSMRSQPNKYSWLCHQVNGPGLGVAPFDFQFNAVCLDSAGAGAIASASSHEGASVKLCRGLDHPFLRPSVGD